MTTAVAVVFVASLESITRTADPAPVFVVAFQEKVVVRSYCTRKQAQRVNIFKHTQGYLPTITPTTASSKARIVASVFDTSEMFCRTTVLEMAANRRLDDVGLKGMLHQPACIGTLALLNGSIIGIGVLDEKRHVAAIVPTAGIHAE